MSETEPISPELALVDPALAAEARSRLPDRPGFPRGGAHRSPRAPSLTLGAGSSDSFSLDGSLHGLLLVPHRSVERVPASTGERRRRRLAVAAVTAAAGSTVAAILAVAAPSAGGFSARVSSDGPAAATAGSSETTADHARRSVRETIVRGRHTPTRRAFVWAPVPRTASYRFELFRGSELVFRSRTAGPRVTVPARWRFAGRPESLGAGSYRWYVWPIPAGRSPPVENANVQARFEVTG